MEQPARTPPFAPPFLKDGEVLIAQTANILLYLGRRLGLAPRDEAGRLWAHQLQLTIADVVDEAHDTHHPIASSLYYEDQRAEAQRRAANFIANRIPKYLGYFDRVLEHNPQGDRHLVGRRISYCDLSLFQLVASLRYAIPRAMAQLEPGFSRVIALHDRVDARPRIAAYLKSRDASLLTSRASFGITRNSMPRLKRRNSRERERTDETQFRTDPDESCREPAATRGAD